MDAYEGYCISKGIKTDAPAQKPSADDVRRWRAMMDEEAMGAEWANLVN